jgi:primosomal replication protein N
MGLCLVQYGYGSLQNGTQRVAQFTLPLVVLGYYDQLVGRALRNGAIEVVGSLESVARTDGYCRYDCREGLENSFHRFIVFVFISDFVRQIYN